jgi:hypothetical protein
MGIHELVGGTVGRWAGGEQVSNQLHLHLPTSPHPYLFTVKLDHGKDESNVPILRPFEAADRVPA